jgi:MFS family permease
MPHTSVRREGPTRRQLALSVAGAFATLAALLAIAAVVLRGAETSALVWGFGGTLAFTLVGIVILWRRPGHGIGRLTLTIGLMFATGAAISASLHLFNPRWGIAPVVRAVGDLLSQSLTIMALLASVIIVVVWFPDGRRSSRLGGLVEALVAVGVASAAVGGVGDWLAQRSDGGQVPLWFAASTTFVTFGALGLSFALALVDIVLRYRQADGMRRAQIRWVVAASGTTVVLLGLLVMVGEHLPGLWDLFLASTILPAIAIAIAITRYRLYDIDRIISRSLGYAIVTGVLAAVFAASAIGLSTLLGSLGQGESLAVAASTLIVLGLFGPLRRRAQAVIDRRFDRASYDASVTVQVMSARLRDNVDLERVEADVLVVVDQTLHPTNAGMWLRGRSR